MKHRYPRRRNVALPGSVRKGFQPRAAVEIEVEEEEVEEEPGLLRRMYQRFRGEPEYMEPVDVRFLREETAAMFPEFTTGIAPADFDPETGEPTILESAGGLESITTAIRARRSQAASAVEPVTVADLALMTAESASIAKTPYAAGPEVEYEGEFDESAEYDPKTGTWTGAVTVEEVARQAQKDQAVQKAAQAASVAASAARKPKRTRKSPQVQKEEKIERVMAATAPSAWSTPPRPGQHGARTTTARPVHTPTETGLPPSPLDNPRLTAAQRRRLPPKAFGIPSQRKYPMMTIGPSGTPAWSKSHAVDAKARAREEYNKGYITLRQYNQIVKKANKVIEGFIDRQLGLSRNPSVESIMRDLPRRRR